MAGYHVPEEYIVDGIVLQRNLYPPEVIEKVRDFAFRPDDALLVTYPKGGTTWVQEITWLIYNDVDVEKARQVPLRERSRYLEMVFPEYVGMDKIQTDPRPAVIKSHLSHGFFQKALTGTCPRIVVVMRNPKDTLVSAYHFYRNNGRLAYDGTWDEFFEVFRDKRLLYGDMFEWNVGWWQHRNNPNVLFLYYEDMLDDAISAIRKIAWHCGKELTEECVGRIAQHTSFDSMKSNPMTNYSLMPGFPIKDFMRKGAVGDWRSLFNKEQAEYVDKLCEELYEPVGIHFRCM